MRKTIGKIVIPALISLLLSALIVMFVLYVPVFGRPVSGTVSDKLGAFTGAGSGQGHNIKASLDLAHTDLDTGLEDFEDTLALMGLGTGSVFYVDNAVAGSTGVTWATAVATIDDAVNLCTADTGDIILVASGHVENLGTTDPDFDKAGITIYGLGRGEDRPVLSFDTSTDIFTIDADDIAVYNLVFLAHTPDVAKGIDITGGSENAIISNCLFTVHTESTDEFLIAINVGAASDNLVVENCEFFMGGGNATEAILFDGAYEYCRITDNIITGDYSTACIFGDATGDGEMLTIKDNILYNGDITIGLNTEPCIELKSGTTGFVIDNSLFCNESSAAAAVVGADMYLAGNTYSETEGSGTALVAGQTYVRVSSAASVAASAVDLFDVLGGRIEILSMMGQCTTVMASNPGACSLIIDATTGDEDADFTTAVNIDSLGVGDVVNFAAVTSGEAVLVPTANVNGALAVSWFCPIGMIEQKTASTGTGAITWYMVFRPLEDGVTVTVQ